MRCFLLGCQSSNVGECACNPPLPITFVKAFISETRARAEFHPKYFRRIAGHLAQANQWAKKLEIVIQWRPNSGSP